MRVLHQLAFSKKQQLLITTKKKKKNDFEIKTDNKSCIQVNAISEKKVAISEKN